MENVDQREEVFAETIELLGKDVAMIHFKDFLLQDADGQLAATGAGQGGMGDYRTILRFAKEQKPYDTPVCPGHSCWPLPPTSSISRRKSWPVHWIIASRRKNCA